VTRESGSEILTLFYPDKITLYISLLTDVPAMLALLACGGTYQQTQRFAPDSGATARCCYSALPSAAC